MTDKPTKAELLEHIEAAEQHAEQLPVQADVTAANAYEAIQALCAGIRVLADAVEAGQEGGWEVNQKQEKKMASKKKLGKRVIITTERRGVFYGTLESYDEKTRVAVLTDALMVIRWGTEHGFFQLAATGPTADSKLSKSVARIRLELCECVVDASPGTEEAWTSRSPR